MRVRALLAVVGAIAATASLIATTGAAASTEQASATGATWLAAKLYTTEGQTAQTAAQTSTDGSFECSPNPTTSIDNSTEQTCVITNEPNARCVEKSDSPVVVQTCDITQNGDVNDAFVRQVIDTNGAPTTISGVQTQTSTQIADVKQAGNQNSVDLSQDVNQSLDASAVTSITQDQDSSQNATVCQGGSSGCGSPNDGANSSKVQQSRFGAAHASGTDVTQCQDTGETDCVPPPTCTSGTFAEVDQHSTSSNDSDLNQQAHLLGQATGASGPTVSQKQHCPGGGITGHVNQGPVEIEAPTSPNQPTVNLPTNKNLAHEHLTDELSGPKGSDQSQDPGLLCCSVNGGGPQSSDDLHQVGTLKATENDAYQQLDINGTTQSGGGCSVLQVGKINIDNITTRDSQPDETPCSAFINCESGLEGGCSGFPPKGPIVDDLALTNLGVDTSDFQDALNFVFPLTLPSL